MHEGATEYVCSSHRMRRSWSAFPPSQKHSVRLLTCRITSGGLPPLQISGNEADSMVKGPSGLKSQWKRGWHAGGNQTHSKGFGKTPKIEHPFPAHCLPYDGENVRPPHVPKSHASVVLFRGFGGASYRFWYFLALIVVS